MAGEPEPGAVGSDVQTGPVPSRTDLTPDARTVWRPRFPVDVRLTLSVLARHNGDPTYRALPDGSVWRTSRMSTGPVSYRIAAAGGGEISARAWGPGADEFVAGVPDLLGNRDDPRGFAPRHPLLERAHARRPGLRIPATGRVMEALIPAILEQKVIGLDAAAAWRRLVYRFGDPAPGPAPTAMRVVPSAATWAALPTWEWHLAGVEEKRARTARVAATYADKLEAAAAEYPDDRARLYRMLTALPGIGVWTAAQIGHRALGDADALPLGDYHLASLTGWALSDGPLPDDEVEAFYEPWRPHRFRVVRLLELTPHAHPPRRGPRLSRIDYRGI
jgi:3-methyladenine DNA glycosylase/8-oxoguanine DNA glycosylase